jgi:tetratricopeptide (TPR) repeat protein
MGRKARLREKQRTTERVVVAGVDAQRATATPDDDRRALMITCTLLVLAIVIVFGRVRSQAFINYDDPPYVTENANVQQGLTAGNVAWAFTSFHASYWHPLTTLSHLIDVQLFGMNAGAHKLVNVALHAAASVLLLLFLARATGQLWPSAAVAALFALHPTRVESVAWVAERKDVLSALFWMLTLLLYLRYVRGGNKRRLIGVTIAFACALMSKPSTVTLPFVLLLLDWWPLRRIESLRDRPRITSLIVEKLPLFALLIPAIVLTLRAQSAAITSTVSLMGRVANTLLSYVAYLRLLVWPVNLGVLYPYRLSIRSIDVVAAAIVLIAITILVLRSANRAPFVAVGWFWFVGAMVPMPGIIQAGRQSMADRFTYLPFVGLFIAVVWGVHALVANRAFAVAMTAILAALSAVTYVQAGYWQNSETIFGHTVDVTANNPIAQLNLGAALMDRGAANEALPHFREAVRLDPENALAHNGLGAALAATGDYAGAAHALRRAVYLDPKLSKAYRKLAEVEMRAGRGSEAAALLEKAGATKNDAATRAELAAARGDVGGAIASYADAVRELPDDAEIRNSYAAMLARKGRDQDALAQYRAALRIRPDHYETNMNVGALLSRIGNDAEALEHFQKAASARPSSPEPHIYLALIYGNRNEAARAIEEVEAAGNINQAEANKIFTNAVHIPFKETNLQEYHAALKAQVGR